MWTGFGRNVKSSYQGSPSEERWGGARSSFARWMKGPAPRCTGEGPAFIQCLPVALASLLSQRVSESHPGLAKTRATVLGLKDPPRTVSHYQEVA